jgi:Rrf2 family protein
MKISRKTDYALKTVLDLALHDQQVVPGPDIARRQDIPLKFLEQILLALKGAGVVTSRRGKNGGYLLAKRPSKITLASVVSLSEGSLSLLPNTGGFVGPTTAAEVESPLREVWADIDDYIAAKLEEVTVQSLCDRVAELSGAKGIQYMI